MVFQNSAKTLEQRDDKINKSMSNAPMNVPLLVYIHQHRSQSEAYSGTMSSPETIIIQEKILVEIKRMSTQKGFLIGLLSSLSFFIILGAIFYYPLKKELAAITAQPEGAVAQWLYQPGLSAYANHLLLIEQQSPFSPLKKSEQLLAAAQQLWPNNADQSYVMRQWQNRMDTKLDNTPIDASWSKTQLLIQQLADKIVKQEKNCGSFTLSYLKMAVYKIQQSYQQNS